MVANVGIRLGLQGGPEVKAELDSVGKSGKAAFEQVEHAGHGASSALDKLIETTRKARSEMAGANAAAKMGGISKEEQDALIAGTKARYSAQVEMLRAGAQEASTINRAQMMEFSHVGRSVVDMMAAGQSLGGALEIEAGRIAQALTSGNGGVMGTLKAVGGGIIGLLTPTRLLIGAVAAIGITAALSYSQWEGAQSRLDASLQGIGRRAGATAEQLNAIARSGAATGNMSLGQGLDLAATFTGAGITPDVTRQAIGYTKAYGRVTGEDDTAAAGKAIAGGLSDPAQGLMTFNKTLGFATDALRTNIDNLVAQGRADDARRMLGDALNKSLADTTEKTTNFGLIMDGIRNLFPNLGKAIAGAVDAPTDDERLSRLLAEREQRGKGVESSILGRGVSAIFGAPNYAGDDAEIQRLQEKRRTDAIHDSDAAAAGKRTIDNNALTLQAGDVIKAVLPSIVSAQTSANNIALLKTALSNPDVMRNLGVTAEQGQQALGNILVKDANADPVQRAAQDYKLAMKALGDYTIAERIETEARKAALQVLRDTGDVVKANAAAEQARNLILEKANQAASDRADMAEQNAKLVGLTPYARGLQEIENKYSGVGGFDKDESTASQISKAMIPVKSDIASAAELLVQALKDAADTIRQGAQTIGGAAMNTPGGLPTFAAGGVTKQMVDAAKAYMASGATAAGAAGFVAGLTNESGLGLDSKADNGSHLGVAQWDGTRWARLSGSHDMSTTMGQVGASISELGGPEARAGRMLYGATSVAGGVAANDAYERPGDAEAARRRGTALARGNALLGVLGGTDGASTAPASTVAASNARGHAAETGAYTQEQYDAPLRSANQSIKDQVALLQVQKDTVGQTTSEIKGAVAAQTLLNRYNDQGVPITDKLSDGIRAYGKSVSDAAKQSADFEAQQKRVIGALDEVRDVGRGAFDSIFQGLKNGESAGKIFQNVLSGLFSKAMQFGENSLLDGLLGKQGTSSGGLFGGGITSFIGSLLGGGSKGYGGPSAAIGAAGIGGNAAGTDDWRGGLTLVGENGPELANIPSHSQIIPSSASMQMLKNQPVAPVQPAAPVIFNVASDVPMETIHRMEGMLRESEARQNRSNIRSQSSIQADAQQKI